MYDYLVVFMTLWVSIRSWIMIPHIFAIVFSILFYFILHSSSFYPLYGVYIVVFTFCFHEDFLPFMSVYIITGFVFTFDGVYSFLSFGIHVKVLSLIFTRYVNDLRISLYLPT